MSKLYIKFTVNTTIQESFCNTSDHFYNTYNGKALKTLQEGIENVTFAMRNLASLIDIMSRVDATEQQHREDAKHDCDAIMQEVIGHISNVYHIEPKYLKVTKYTKSKQSVSFLMGTITIQIEK
jgi:hypothetical protein